MHFFIINAFAVSLNQAVHTKTARLHVALCWRNSGTESARELFRRSKDLACLAVCNEKIIFFLFVDCRFFVSNIVSGRLLDHLCPLNLAQGPNC